jgi:hypothetical protein
MAKKPSTGRNLEQDVTQLFRAAIGDSLRELEDAWVVITAEQNAELDGYGAGYVYIRRQSPANPEVTAARLKPNKRKFLLNGLCVEVRHTRKDDKGVEWLIVDMGERSFEQFPGTVPNETLSAPSITGGSIASVTTLTVVSTTNGSIPMPVMTETQRDAIATPVEGMWVFNSDTERPNYYDGAGWIAVGMLPVSTDNVTNPPTDAELDTAFGTPATVGAGFTALLDDNGAGTNVYHVASDGTNWWYAAMTKAV